MSTPTPPQTTHTRLRFRSTPGVALRLLAGSALVVVAVTLAACSSSGSSASSTTKTTAASAPTTAASAPTTTTAGSSGSTTGATIVIKNFAFSPSAVTVAPGATVTVTNDDQVAHTITASDGKFNTGDIASGQSKTFTAPNAAGKYTYICSIHQYMSGTLTVS